VSREGRVMLNPTLPLRRRCQARGAHRGRLVSCRPPPAPRCRLRWRKRPR
jgi:hypothetical protein